MPSQDGPSLKSAFLRREHETVHVEVALLKHQPVNQHMKHVVH